MITKITLDKVASYKKPATLETDKPVNLIYGLNGTGKSTLSNYLRNPNNPIFASCFLENATDKQIHVYNQKYIHEIFFESEELKGIFTLSKTNRDAELKIETANKEIQKIDEQLNEKFAEIESINEILNANHHSAKTSTWEIKTKYTGGDRVLEFCLEGLKSDGNKLLAYLLSLKKPETISSKTIEDVKQDVQSLTGEYGNILEILPLYNYDLDKIETDRFLEKQIVGNENSTVSELINKLGNSDWVKEGLQFVSSDNEENPCPFCQQKTISSSLKTEIKKYFDESYENDLMKLRSNESFYSLARNVIPSFELPVHPKLDNYKSELQARRAEFYNIVAENANLLSQKLKSPSIPISLTSSKDALKSLENCLTKINKVIENHNLLVSNKSAAFEKIKHEFWDIMRNDYDSELETYTFNKSKQEEDQLKIQKKIEELNTEKNNQLNIIATEQKKTINIEEAIQRINTNLLDLGIEDFKIKKYSDVFYKIAREDNDSKIFHTLSEGEKMIISFLYFIEECAGKKEAGTVEKKKIIVIDDPISSLSHIYVFNVGRLIMKEFLQSGKYEQIFILTHSLYFFYELTDISKERRDKNQKLFRIRKNTEGAEIFEMKYEEIQNDYHSYWQVINDEKQPPALIANCMRKIIEYFFNFVEKKDLNNVFQKPSLQAQRFGAFNRFINRESHSLGQNIFDYKEFNYLDFKTGFELLFTEAGYTEHYKKMSSLN